MERYEKLRLNFFSCDLKYGKIELRPGHNCDFFFIVNNPVEKEFMKKQALQMVLSQCKHFEFFGRYANEWHNAIDEAHIAIYPNASEEEIVMMVTDDTLEDFVEELRFYLSCRCIVPFDIYLIYDDVDLYKQVLERIKINYSIARPDMLY